MLRYTKTFEFILELRNGHGYQGKIYLYTAYWDKDSFIQSTMLRHMDGITFTIHAEANDKDIIALKSLSEHERLADSDFSSRLIIDNRIYDRYDFSNIDLTNWDVIRKLQWKDYCEPAPNEELVEFLL